MELGRAQIVRTVKRLAEAIGYLELGLSQRALDVLEGIEEPGPFTAVAEMLRGEAARLEDRLPEAVYSFEKAARMLAAPDNKSIWYALSQFVAGLKKAGGYMAVVSILLPELKGFQSQVEYVFLGGPMIISKRNPILLMSI